MTNTGQHYGVATEQWRDLVSDIEDFINAHNRGHANSNSPYGHVCGKRCFAESLGLWMRRRDEQRDTALLAATADRTELFLAALAEVPEALEPESAPQS